LFVDLEVGNLCEPGSGRGWDRREIHSQIWRRIAFLRASGLTRNDRVLIHYGNTMEFFADLMAIWSLGGCAIPVDPRLTSFEVETLAATARPKLSLWHDSVDKSAAAAVGNLGVRTVQTDGAFDDHRPLDLSGPLTSQLDLDQQALILFTSGTTGKPKGVVHTHRTLRARWMSLRENLDLANFRRSLCLLPTHFGHGLICNCLFPWLSGQDLFILPPFRTDTIMQLGNLIDEYEITFLSSVPTVWRLALKIAKPPQGKSLKQIHCGSAPLSAHLWQQVKEWTGTDNVLNAYGITETGSWVAGTSVANVEVEDGLIGRPWGAVIKVLKNGTTDVLPSQSEECKPSEQGYVWINTPALMQGYLGRDDLTHQVISQGWFLTGDIGLIDDRGLLYLRGREREEINKGGLKIFPGDIDSVVERFPEALDVCTFGYQDQLYGEDVGIALVLKRSDKKVLDDLYDWTRRHLAEHKMPRRWYLLSEIPRTSRGKVSRAQVAEACKGLTPTDVGGG
jgi:acyl-CoA synthetase (AMP-forming)/AMP-acid ligase II